MPQRLGHRANPRHLPSQLDHEASDSDVDIGDPDGTQVTFEDGDELEEEEELEEGVDEGEQLVVPEGEEEFVEEDGLGKSIGVYM